MPSICALVLKKCSCEMLFMVKKRGVLDIEFFWDFYTFSFSLKIRGLYAYAILPKEE